MDYIKTYTNAFNNKLYANEYHIQYDWVIEKLKKKYSSNDIFTIIDVGSGRGQMLKMINKNFPKAIITSVDLNNFHKLDFVDFFINCDITSFDDRNNLLKNKYDVLVNLDFLEHIEEKYIDNILETFYNLSPYCIISIANHSDCFDGIELHLIQKNNKWWTIKLEKNFSIISFSDNGEDTLYFYEVVSKKIK